jgi:hypothetical protein
MMINRLLLTATLTGLCFTALPNAANAYSVAAESKRVASFHQVSPAMMQAIDILVNERMRMRHHRRSH